MTHLDRLHALQVLSEANADDVATAERFQAAVKVMHEHLNRPLIAEPGLWQQRLNELKAALDDVLAWEPVHVHTADCYGNYNDMTTPTCGRDDTGGT